MSNVTFELYRRSEWDNGYTRGRIEIAFSSPDGVEGIYHNGSAQVPARPSDVYDLQFGAVRWPPRWSYCATSWSKSQSG